MIFDEVRVDLEEYFTPLWEAEYPDIELISENAKAVDLSLQEDPILLMNFDYRGDSRQANMNGDNPLSRFKGFVVFQLLVKEFTGKKVTNDGLSFISNTLAYKQIGELLLKQPVPMPSATAIGWAKGGLNFPFQFDTLRQPT